MAVDRPRGQFLGDQLHFYHPAQAGSLRRASSERAAHLDARRHALAQQRIHASFSAHHHSLMQLQHRQRPTSVRRLTGIASPSGSATTSFCPGAWATRQRAHALVGAHARARRPQQQHQRDNARASGTRAGSVGSGLSHVGQSDVGHSPDHTHTHTHTPTSLYV